MTQQKLFASLLQYKTDTLVFVSLPCTRNESEHYFAYNAFDCSCCNAAKLPQRIEVIYSVVWES